MFDKGVMDARFWTRQAAKTILWPITVPILALVAIPLALCVIVGVFVKWANDVRLKRPFWLLLNEEMLDIIEGAAIILFAEPT